MTSATGRSQLARMEGFISPGGLPAEQGVELRTQGLGTAEAGACRCEVSALLALTLRKQRLGVKLTKIDVTTRTLERERATAGDQRRSLVAVEPRPAFVVRTPAAQGGQRFRAEELLSHGAEERDLA